MTDREAKPLKDWRELKGMSRKELAEKLNETVDSSIQWWPVYADQIARWEDVGFPVHDDSEADLFAHKVVGPLMRILEVDAEIIAKNVPTSPNPGDFVLDGESLEQLAPDVSRFLEEHADEIGLRMAIPNGYDVAPKPYEALEQADYQALVDYGAAEIQHSMDMIRMLESGRAQLSEHTTDPNATVQDVFEERGGKLAPKPPKEPPDEAK